MHTEMDLSRSKEYFLAENQQFTEFELGDETKSVGKFEDIDLADNEIWLLQCPKGMDLKELESQKLKIPGRTNLGDTEAVSVEFVEDAEKHAFAYCNRKGKYDLRLLPVRGTIVLRNRLKPAISITAERIEECCPATKRVPLPPCIRVRHPLLGHQFHEKLQLDSGITTRLREADEVSAKILKERLVKKVTTKCKPQATDTPIVIKSEDDVDASDVVMFVREDVVKKKKSKRNRSDSQSYGKDNSSKKKKKSSKSCEDTIAKDLQWLQDL